MPALDRYDQADIDDEEVPEAFEDREAARLMAEDAMDQAQGRRRTRLPGALLEGGHLSTAVLPSSKINWSMLSSFSPISSFSPCVCCLSLQSACLLLGCSHTMNREHL